MVRPRSIPTYRLHKKSGQAVTTLTDPFGRRKDYLLGPYNSPASQIEYRRVLAEWQAAGRLLTGQQLAADRTISELLVLYWEHAVVYYRYPDGRPTSEQSCLRGAMKRLRQLYEHTLAADFDSLALEAVRQNMIAEGLCRKRINKDIGRLKMIFKWAASKKLVPVTTYQNLLTLTGLRQGRSAAAERPPVKPVKLDAVYALLPFLSPHVSAMVQLQMHTSMRPGEVIALRGRDLEMTGSVWYYRPGSDQGPAGQHKTAWRGHQRVIAIGPKAQAILQPWLRANADEYLFQPAEAEAQRRLELRQQRKTKVQPSQHSRKRRYPKHQPGDCYTVSSYRRAITRALDVANRASACPACQQIPAARRCAACLAAALPSWHPISCGIRWPPSSARSSAWTRPVRCWATVPRSSPKFTPNWTWPRPPRSSNDWDSPEKSFSKND